MSVFAVIDTETTWGDQVMSIGVVIADDETKEMVDSKYFLIDPEYKKPGMYSSQLMIKGVSEPVIAKREAVIECLDAYLQEKKVDRILAYNASFDRNHLPELQKYIWIDIMRIAAYRQYNPFIPQIAECFGTGKLKRGYGVESVLRMIEKGNHYSETHNAYFDAMDELRIVRLLGHPMSIYENARLGK